MQISALETRAEKRLATRHRSLETKRVSCLFCSCSTSKVASTLPPLLGMQP
jgi:hypothetical protein